MTQALKLSAVLIAALAMCAPAFAQEAPVGVEDETNAANVRLKPRAGGTRWRRIMPVIA